MINLGVELLRISPKGTIEFSKDGGRIWQLRYGGSTAGMFRDLLPYGSEVLAVTSKGLYYSRDRGGLWNVRYSGSTAGEFISLVDGGRELLANTSRDLFYSTNSGHTWLKK